MKTYKVDLDYESSLFDPVYSADSSASKRIIREFEYVFFLIEKEKCILKNFKDYEKKYLEHLKTLGFSIPDFNPHAQKFNFWWGSHHDFKTEQLLNSKITSAKLGLEFGWGFHEGAIVSSLDELKIHLQKFPFKENWIIKRPHSFSGIGHYHFQQQALNESAIEKILSSPALLEPVYERIFDIGTTFVIENKKIQRQFMVENFNSQAGGFLGGAGSENVDKFKKYILERYSFDLSELEDVTLKIAKKYMELGAISNVQIDSFIYKDNGQLKLYPLVEVNYRKTMGLVIQSLADKFQHKSHIEWKVLTAKNSGAIDENPDWIKLSPAGNHFHSYFKIF